MQPTVDAERFANHTAFQMADRSGQPPPMAQQADGQQQESKFQQFFGIVQVGQTLFSVPVVLFISLALSLSVFS